MDKNGENQQSPSVPQQDIKFSSSFTPEIDVYIAECQKNNTKPTVLGFAKRIGTDQHSLWAWAGKKKKDEQGNVTEQLARPHFNAALTKLYELEKEEKADKLNPNQELFCKLYASDKEFFGNGVISYAEAYGLDLKEKGNYNTARANASRLLTNASILKRINELLEVDSLNDAFVDKQLAFVIAQNVDLSSKTAAIREYNKLKTRIVERIDHTTKGKELPQPIMGGSAYVSADNSNA